jgi:hypothetical protein
MLLVNLGTQWEFDVVETALRGRIVAETSKTYIVDFTEYARAKSYQSYLAGSTEVSKFLCSIEK